MVTMRDFLQVPKGVMPLFDRSFDVLLEDDLPSEERGRISKTFGSDRLLPTHPQLLYSLSYW